MDPQSGLLSRAGTSFWTLLQGAVNFITSAVGRYLRSELPNTGNDDINIIPEATVCKQSHEEEEKSLNENDKEKERENEGDDAESSGKKLADACQITLATDSKSTQCNVRYVKSVVTENGDKEHEKKDHDQMKIITVTANLSNEDAEKKGNTQEEIQQGDMRHDSVIEPGKAQRGKQDNYQTEDDIQKYEWQIEQKVDIKQHDAKSAEDDFKGERTFDIKVKTVGRDYRTMEDTEGILGIEERQSEMRKGKEVIQINQSYKESQTEQEGNEQSGGLEETGPTSRERKVTGQENEKNEVNIQALEGEFTANVFEQEREKHRLKDKGEMEEIRGELEALNQNEESLSVEWGDESCGTEKSEEDGKRETYSCVLERRKETEYKPHGAQISSSSPDCKSDTNQEEEGKTNGQQMETGAMETEGSPQEVNIETKYKIAVVEMEDGKDEENEKETKSDEEKAIDLGNREIQMGGNFKQPQDEIKQEEECGWKEEVETTRWSGHGSITENEKHKKEIKGIDREITVTVEELRSEMQRIEEEEDVEGVTEDLEAAEEEDVEGVTEDLEAADKPLEFVTTEEKKELFALGKDSRVGEMEVCSSEFERSEERDNYVEKEDVEIHFENRWPVQARTEQHSILGFYFQELEKVHKERDMVAEDKVVAMSQMQRSDESKDEESAQQDRETEHRCHRAHVHSGEEEEDKESGKNQKEEKTTDAEQIEAGEVETEGEQQEVSMEIKYRMTEAGTKYGKDEENEETRSDEVETHDLGTRDIALETSVKEPEDEIKEAESGRVEDKSKKQRDQGSVTENEKQKEMKELESKITVSIAELERERDRIEEEEDVEGPTKDLKAGCKHQESATEEGQESCVVEKGSKDDKWDVYSSDVEKRKEEDANIEKEDPEVHFEAQWSLETGTKEHLRLGFDFQESEKKKKELVDTSTKEEDVNVSGTQWRDYMKHEESVCKQTENNQEKERKTDELIDTEEMKMGEPQEINIENKCKLVTVEGDNENDANDMETPELGEDEMEINKSCKEPQHEIKREEGFGRSVDTESIFGDEQGKILENERNDGLQGLEIEITVNTVKLETIKPSKEEEKEINELIEYLEVEDKSQKPVLREVGEESHAVKKSWEDGERELCSTELKEEEKDIKANEQDINVQSEDKRTAQSEGYLPSLVSSQKFTTAHETDQAIAADKPVVISVTQWRDDMQPKESIYKGTEIDKDGESQRTKGQTDEKDRSHISTEWDIKITEEDAVHEETSEAASQQSKTAEELNFSGEARNDENNELCRREDTFNGIEMKNDSKVKDVNAVEMKDDITEIDQEAITRSLDEPEERKVGETDIDDTAGIRDEFHVKDTTGKNVDDMECREDERRTEHVWEKQTEEREEQVAPAYIASMEQKEKGQEDAMDERGSEVFVEGEGVEVLKFQSISSKNKVVGEDTEGSEVLVDEKEELQAREDAETWITERNATSELAKGQTEHKGYLRQESEDRMTMEDSGENVIMVLDVNSELVEDCKDKSAHDELGAVRLRSGLAESKSEEAPKSDYNEEMRAQVCKTDEEQEVTEVRDWVEGEETENEQTENSKVYTHETERTKIQGEDTKQEQKKSDKKELCGQNGKTEMLVTETLEEEEEEEEKEEQPLCTGGAKREVGEGTRADMRNEDIAQDGVQKGDDKQTHEDESNFFLQVDAPSLDFTAQKSRIALKNCQVRPPKHPRILLQKASVIPIHSAPPQEEGFNTKPVMVKVGGGGVMAIKLPGFGGGIPALKKSEGGVKRKSEEVSGQITEKELAANAGTDVREQSSTKQREVGPKIGGVGAIGVKLPVFGTGLPVLRKTDRGVKMREEIADDSERPHGENGTARAEGKGAESKEKEVKSTGAPAGKLPGFGAGFPVLRKTERGMKLRSGEDLEKSEADNLNDVDKPDGGSQSKKANVENPLLSELKFKLKKTDGKRE